MLVWVWKVISGADFFNEEDRYALEGCTAYSAVAVQAVVAGVCGSRCRNVFAAVGGKVAACCESKLVATAIFAAQSYVISTKRFQSHISRQRLDASTFGLFIWLIVFICWDTYEGQQRIAGESVPILPMYSGNCFVAVVPVAFARDTYPAGHAYPGLKALLMIFVEFPGDHPSENNWRASRHVYHCNRHPTGALSSWASARPIAPWHSLSEWRR